MVRLTSPSALLLSSVFLLGGWLIFWSLEEAVPRDKERTVPFAAARTGPTEPAVGGGQASLVATPVTTPPRAVRGEHLLVFSSEEELERFLAEALPRGFILLGRSEFTPTLRIRVDHGKELHPHLPEGTKVEYNYVVRPPALEPGSLSPHAVPFLGRIKEWLGIRGEHPKWGAGFKVAVIDTGLRDHPVFGVEVARYSIVDLPPGSQPHPHGTAMASLWREGKGDIPAIAPAVDLMSVQVADEDGTSNTFLLAEAISLAVREGAQIITISMGAYARSQVLSRAVDAAKAQGVLIVASAGNENSKQALMPASHEAVLGVGGIDYFNNPPGFSNYGTNLDLVAPAVGIRTAGEGETYSYSTGTSPSAQIAASVLVAFMDHHRLEDPYGAADLLLQNLNDLGPAGRDERNGAGRPQLDVLFRYNLPGIYDAALSAMSLQRGAGKESAALQVVVNNPGTEPLISAVLEVDLGGQRFLVNLPEIGVKNSHTQIIPYPIPLTSPSLTITGEVRLKPGLSDSRPRDNVMKSTVTLTSP